MTMCWSRSSNLRAPPQARRLEPEGDNPAALACSYVLPTSARVLNHGGVGHLKEQPLGYQGVPGLLPEI